jgi:hypothetical protein
LRSDDRTAAASPANRTILDCTFHADVFGPNGEHLVDDMYDAGS